MSLGRCLGLLVMVGCAGYACEGSDGDGGPDALVRELENKKQWQ